ncbi:t-SNARE [Phlyctochytrium arcticum]|nr:t-SNARE [Phlyctochytrium arcticum]
MSRDRTADLRRDTRQQQPQSQSRYQSPPLSQSRPGNAYSRSGNNNGYGGGNDGGYYGGNTGGGGDVEMGRYPRGNSNSTLNAGGYNSGPAGRPATGGSSLDNFFAEVEEVQAGLERARQNIKEVETLHQRALVATSPDEQARYTRQVDAMQDESSDLIQQLRTQIKRITSQTQSAPQSDVPIRQQQQQGLAKRLMEVAQDYQKVQSKSKDRYRQRMEREIRIARPDATPQEVEQALDSQSGSVFSQQLLSSRIGAQRQALNEVQNRHVEIQRIEQSINELFNLFQEMQDLLEQQQETINAIETHVENTNVYIEDGNKEMTQAIVHRKSSRKTAWWICGCVIVLLIIAAVIVYFQVIRPMQNTTPAPAPAS